MTVPLDRRETVLDLRGLNCPEPVLRAKKALPLYSPISGVVTQKSVVQGMRINPGDMPYEITTTVDFRCRLSTHARDLRSAGACDRTEPLARA